MILEIIKEYEPENAIEGNRKYQGSTGRATHTIFRCPTLSPGDIVEAKMLASLTPSTQSIDSFEFVRIVRKIA